MYEVCHCLLQVETLEQEKRQLSLDLEEAYRRHKEDMEMQQMHHFQVVIVLLYCVHVPISYRYIWSVHIDLASECCCNRDCFALTGVQGL